MEKVSIHTEYIKLDQFLKWAGIAETGSHAKTMIINGYVNVNGQKELRRGKKIRKGDIVEVGERVFMVE
ncbi:MAG TPA: S4 domain-containing protein YaaA [Clostridiaceae bacterium]|nr:S4 domain-containing protein YaaA [Clostridiaceae bacterium]